MNRIEINTVAEQILSVVMAGLHLSRWLTIAEACQYSKVKRETLMKWIDEGHVYASKTSGKWIIDRTSIDDYFNKDRLQLIIK